MQDREHESCGCEVIVVRINDKVEREVVVGRSGGLGRRFR